jgi:hypothetical protein
MKVRVTPSRTGFGHTMRSVRRVWRWGPRVLLPVLTLTSAAALAVIVPAPSPASASGTSFTQQRADLVESLDDHHVTQSAFTAEGTFTCDSKLYAFSLRYEIRVDGERPDDLAIDRGLRQAEQFLRTLGIGCRNLRVTATDMQSMWAAATRRKRN